MTDHTDLIKRLEAADGPSRELDAEIALPFGWERVHHPKYSWQKPNGMYSTIGLPEFTSSVDAALTLVPEGMRRRTIVNEDGRASVQLCWPGEGWLNPMGKLYANEALAICIAALKAQEQTK